MEPTSFPLYDQIYKGFITGNLSPFSDDKITFIVDTINVLGELEHERIFALIRMYQKEREPLTLKACTVPYGGKAFKKGIRFDFDKLPLELQHLIGGFVDTHLNNTV